MDIKNRIQATIDQINADAERELVSIKDQCVRECVSYNQDLEQARGKAEAELAQKLNLSIQALQSQFAKDKQALVDACEKKKAEHFNGLLATKSYAVTSERDKAVAKLKALIPEKE